MGCVAVRRDFGVADEGGAFLDDDAHGFEVAEEFRVGLEFAALLDGDIAVHGAVDGDGLRADLAFDSGVLAKDERAFGDDFAVEFAVENHFGVELEGAGQLHIAGKDVLGGGGFGNERGDVVKVHVFAKTLHAAPSRGQHPARPVFEFTREDIFDGTRRLSDAADPRACGGR